ncbi:MAG: hypothetical protein WAN92_02440 [Herbaspirillum sp.]
MLADNNESRDVMSSAPSSSSTLHSHGLKLLAMLALCMTLSACDYFQKPVTIQTPEEAKAEGVALGAGCRQVGHSLENCYERNPNSLKEGIFTGWKEMNEYMATKDLPTLESSSSKSTSRRERAKTEKATDKDAKTPDSKSNSKNSKENRDNASPKK